ncbi:MAG TPA: hypothetical protein VGM90_04530 [Kofleriaceae bacterium]|jgi:hypothetical protein
MPMMMRRFRFAHDPDVESLRMQLRAEVGARLASERSVEMSSGGGVVELLSMDAIGLVYASKVCVVNGGESERAPWTPPGWASRPWVDVPWLTKLKLWIGPTKLVG